MKLTEFSVKHWQFTVVLFVMLGVLGYASWSSIPWLEDPPLAFPTYTVVAVYPGANPTDLERLVVKKLEEKLDELDDLKSLDSRIRDGVATIRVEFEPSQDADRKYDE